MRDRKNFMASRLKPWPVGKQLLSILNKDLGQVLHRACGRGCFKVLLGCALILRLWHHSLPKKQYILPANLMISMSNVPVFLHKV